MTHDITNVNQKAKLSYINARADWKEDLEIHLATQMQLIKVWDVMKNEEQYSMTDLSPDDVDELGDVQETQNCDDNKISIRLTYLNGLKVEFIPGLESVFLAGINSKSGKTPKSINTSTKSYFWLLFVIKICFKKSTEYLSKMSE